MGERIMEFNLKTIYSENISILGKISYSIKRQKDDETIGYIKQNSGRYNYYPFPDTFYDLLTLKDLAYIIEQLEK